jgi:hypothetical protein
MNLPRIKVRPVARPVIEKFGQNHREENQQQREDRRDLRELTDDRSIKQSDVNKR